MDWNIVTNELCQKKKDPPSYHCSKLKKLEFMDTSPHPFYNLLQPHQRQGYMHLHLYHQLQQRHRADPEVTDAASHARDANEPIGSFILVVGMLLCYCRSGPIFREERVAVMSCYIMQTIVGAS